MRRRSDSDPTDGQAGMSLIEVLLAMFLMGIGLLAVAPMFVASVEGNAVTGDLGTVGSAGMERMELLRQMDYDSLVVGGDVDADVAGYFEQGPDDVTVRWEIADNVSLANTKIVSVHAFSPKRALRPRGKVSLVTVRSR